MNYDFTSYSDDFDHLPEDERVECMLKLYDVDFDMYQLDNMSKHLSLLSDHSFRLFIRTAQQKVFDNNNLIDRFSKVVFKVVPRIKEIFYKTELERKEKNREVAKQRKAKKEAKGLLYASRKK